MTSSHDDTHDDLTTAAPQTDKLHILLPASHGAVDLCKTLLTGMYTLNIGGTCVDEIRFDFEISNSDFDSMEPDFRYRSVRGRLDICMW